ncbi:MAG: MBL fold metallo-hydrolase [Patescibacteria group bacterium]|nr:MBL fold metallo-hydrolase [Patescibacteria group bacterium]
MKKSHDLFKVFIYILIALDLVIWYLIFFSKISFGPELYFLKVGQGDSSLVVLPGGNKSIKYLIDGGPLQGGVVSNLEKIFGIGDRYIDLVFVSHPEVDHFGGLIDVLKNYDVGAVLYNGNESDDVNWKEFNAVILQKNIPKISLQIGDSIIYASSTMAVLNSTNLSASSNDSGLALFLESGGLRVLYMADLSAKMERSIVENKNIQTDVLKVSHHGSKYSSDPMFLGKIDPKISVIEVGKNSYGHPTKEVLNRLADVGSQVFRTDLQGIIKIVLDAGKIKVLGI